MARLVVGSHSVGREALQNDAVNRGSCKVCYSENVLAREKLHRRIIGRIRGAKIIIREIYMPFDDCATSSL
jgi:hypothetical protein